MKSLYLSLAAASLSLLLPDAAAAQDNGLTQDITVEHDVVAVTRDAFKTSMLPVISLPKIERPRLSIITPGVKAPLPHMFATAPAVAYGNELPDDNRRGYAAAGYFPALNIGATAGYRLIDRERTKLDLSVQFDTRRYDGATRKPDWLRDPADMPDGYRIHDTSLAAQLGFTRLSAGGNRFGIRGAYTLADLSMASPAISYVSDYFGTFAYDWIAPMTRRVHMADLDIDWQSAPDDAATPGQVTYYAGASYSLTANTGVPAADNLYGPWLPLRLVNQNVARLTGGFADRLSASSVAGIDVDVNLLFNSSYMSDIAYNRRHDATTAMLASVSPYYRYQGEKATVLLGATVDGGVHTGKAIYVSPRVSLALHPAQFFAIEAEADGGRRLNTQRQLMAISRYSMPLQAFDPSRMPLRAGGRLTAGPFRGISLQAYATYAIANGWVMPMLNSECSGLFYTYDLKGWRLGAALQAEAGRWGSLRVAYEWNPSDRIDRGFCDWYDNARRVLEASLTVRPIRRLEINAGWQLRAGRRLLCRSNDEANNDTKWGGVVRDLSVGATYDITRSIGVFARVSNLLNHHYLTESGIEAQGLSGLAGVAVRF